MTRDDVLARLKALKPLLDSYGVTRLRLFGSHARDDAGPDSDVDLVVDFAKRPTLFSLGDFQSRLSEALRTPADVMTAAAIKPRYRDAILVTAVDVIY